MSGHFIYPDAYGWPKWPHMLDENVQWPRYNSGQGTQKYGLWKWVEQSNPYQVHTQIPN